MSIIKATSSASLFRTKTSVSISIQASPEIIMSLLTSSQKWNSTIIRIGGEVKQGNTIQLVSTLDPTRTFNLKVVELTPTTLVWKDGFAPLFSAVRTFKVLPQADGSSLFSMEEVFSGIMLHLFFNSLPHFKPNFEQYANDLKAAAEKELMVH